MPGAVMGSIDMADYLNGLTGTAVTVAVSQWGTGPSVRMMFGYDSVGQVQERTAVATADPGFMERAKAFQNDVGRSIESRSSVLRRIA